jgi:ribulose-5-phosphate 4-epimerase/fuculose-1-phosphate aldolase
LIKDEVTMLETICEIFQEAYRRNWITARDGNASIRWRDRDHFYVTPSGVRKQNLQPEMFKKIGLHERLSAVPPFISEGHSVLEYTDVSSGLKPSGELPLHFGLQRKIDTEVRVVLHMHPTYTVAAMYRGINLAELVKEFPELSRYTRVGSVVPDVPPISQALADATIPALELESSGRVANHIVGIDRHGVVSVDTSPWRAFEHIERLEHICKIVLASRK